MNDAWEQIGDVLAANAAIRRLHLAVGVAGRWHQAHLQPLAAANSERAASLLAPVSSRVMIAGKTLLSTQSVSIIPPVLTSAAFRRVLRPGARLMRTLPFDATIRPDNLLARVEAGAVSAAPLKPCQPGLVTVDQAAAAAPPAAIPGIVKQLLTWFGWLPQSGPDHRDHPSDSRCPDTDHAHRNRFAAAGRAGLVCVAKAGSMAIHPHRRRGPAARPTKPRNRSTQLPTSSNFVLESPGASFQPTARRPRQPDRYPV